MTATVDVPTAAGPGRLVVQAPRSPHAVLLLGHGAGGGLDSFDMSALAAELPARGIAVVRFAQPWLVAGRKIAGPPTSLDTAWKAALAVTARKWRGKPLVVGGRSAGARVACRCFAEPAAGVLALAFPLHPPGKPEKTRRDELASVPAPVLIVQGEADPFGTPDEVRAAIRHATGKHRLVTVNAGHSLQPAKRGEPDAAVHRIVESVASFVDELA